MQIAKHKKGAGLKSKMEELGGSRVKNRKEAVINWIKIHKFLVCLILILIFAFILRFKLSILEMPVAEWWDSADYMSTAKAFAFPDFKENVTQFGVSARRPFFLAMIWAVILFFNGNDAALHYPIIIISLLAVYFTYLLGRKMFNEKVGLLAAFMLGVSWIHLFFTARLLTDVSSMAFWLMAAFFFWKGYIEEEGSKYIWYGAIFFGLSIFTRAASILNIIPILAVFIIKERHKFILNKNLWISILCIILVMSPFVIWLYSNFDNPIQKFTGLGGGEQRFRAAQGGFKISDLADLWNNLVFITTSFFGPTITSYLNAILLTPKFIGLILVLIVLWLCSDAILGIDVLFKERKKELIKKAYLAVWFLTPYLFYSIINPGVEDRYLFAMFPVMFLLFSDAILRLSIKINKYLKYSGVVLLIVLFVGFAYFNIADGNKIHKEKRLSFAEIAWAGAWIKENSQPNEMVISASKYQNMYYSERDTFPFCEDAECKNNETLFIEKRLKEINPKFVVVSVYEPGFTPKWAFTIAERYPDLLIPVQAFGPNGQNKPNPYLIVYEYKSKN